MKYKIVLTVLVCVLLLSSLPAVANDGEGKHDCTCTMRDVAGTWGYSETGSIIPSPGVVIPYGSVGKYTIDRDGNLTGARTASMGGTITPATIEGTATVNPDCTGTLTLYFYDDEGTLTGGAVKSVVYLNGATEARMIVTFPENVTVLITDAKKLSPKE